MSIFFCYDRLLQDAASRRLKWVGFPVIAGIPGFN